MKKFALRAAMSTVILAIVAMFSAAPSMAIGPSAESITQSNHFLQGNLNTQMWSPATFTANGFVSGTTSFTITPSLPSGLSMDVVGGTASITGTPTVAYAPVNHTVTVTGTSSSTNTTATATATIQVSVASPITVTSNVTQLPANTLVSSPITVSFAHDSFISGTTGGIGFTVTGFTPTNTSSCAQVTIDVANAGCTVSTNPGSITYSWTGVNFNTTSNYVITIAANEMTSGNGVGQGAWAGLNVNLSQTPGSPPQMNFGNAMVTIGNPPVQQQQQQNSSPATTASVELSAAIGDSIADAPVPYSASGLLPGSSFDVTVRSTPTRIDYGVVPQNGVITGYGLMPSGLEPGWHTITFTTTAANGTETKDVIWFKIASDGTLLSKADSEPAELAFTGVVSTGAIPLSIIVLLMGFAAFFIAREINPDFMRVMTLTRNAQGELDFVKRRIRSEDF